MKVTQRLQLDITQDEAQALVTELTEIGSHAIQWGTDLRQLRRLRDYLTDCGFTPNVQFPDKSRCRHDH